MKGGDICPFYGKSDDLCDVGCVYISPHDVSVIIKYCSANYTECAKYQELAERFPGRADVPPQAADAARPEQKP